MNIYRKFAKISATAGVLLSLGFVNVRKAEAIAFNMDWTGQTLGYEGKGKFSYDETKVPTDGIVRKNDLESFDITFSDPNGNLIAKFEDDHLSEGFNFNFDTATGKILQSGLWDAPDGISIGEPREQGLNFWSVPGALFDDDSELPPSPNPHVHLTDWLGEYPRANASKIKLGAAMPHQRDCAIAKNTSESYRRYFLNSVGIINNYFYSL